MFFRFSILAIVENIHAEKPMQADPASISVYVWPTIGAGLQPLTSCDRILQKPFSINVPRSVAIANSERKARSASVNLMFAHHTFPIRSMTGPTVSGSEIPSDSPS
jgi:hypothetical protein